MEKMNNKISIEYINVCKQEVEWYSLNGKYRNRIRKDNNGVQYVIGDWSWNRNHMPETIEPAMKSSINYDKYL